MLTLAMIIGLWTTNCIKTQINVNQGYTTESYEFKASGEFEHTRKWYKDSRCQDLLQVEDVNGRVEIGKKINVFTISVEAYGADFNTSAGIDLGAISLKNNSSILLSRGVSNSYQRNTMMSLFPFYKVN